MSAALATIGFSAIASAAFGLICYMLVAGWPRISAVIRNRKG